MTSTKLSRRRDEERLHITVAAYLNYALADHVFWCHAPNGGSRNKAEAAKLKGMGVKPGTPDILLVHDGLAHWIELKAGKGRLSKAQEVTHVRLNNAGCPIALAWSLEEVERTLRRWRIPLKARIAA